MIEIIIFIVVYLAGCLVNFIIAKKNKMFEFGDVGDGLFAVMFAVFILPYILLIWLLCALFIISSWVGTVIYFGYHFYDKFLNWKHSNEEARYKQKLRKYTNGQKKEIFDKLKDKFQGIKIKGGSVGLYRFEEIKDDIDDSIIEYSIQYRDLRAKETLNEEFKKIVSEMDSLVEYRLAGYGGIDGYYDQDGPPNVLQICMGILPSEYYKNDDYRKLQEFLKKY